jgi:hypothetical protein
MTIHSLDGKKLEIENSCEDECPQCGESGWEMYYIPDWMTHRCHGCLIDEARKFHYVIDLED